MYIHVPMHVCVCTCECVHVLLWTCAFPIVWCFLLPLSSMTYKASFQVELFTPELSPHQTWDVCEVGTDSFALCQPSMALWEPRGIALTLLEFTQLEAVSLYLALVTATPLFALATCLGETCPPLYTINRKTRSLAFH